MSQSDQFSSPFAGGGGDTPDPKNPFEIVNEDRPSGGSPPSPFETVAAESPFGLAENEAASAPAQLPSPSSEAPHNPFHSGRPKSAEAEVPAFEMPKSGEGGFEMKGISASEAPVGKIDTAPLGKEDAGDSAFAGGEQKPAAEASNPFGAAKEASVAERPAAEAPGDFGGMPERKAPVAAEAPVFPGAAAAAAPMAAPVVEAPVAKEPEPVAAPAPVVTPSAPLAPIESIKQLEVRAIFGVDRELSRSELIQRAKALPGIKNLSSVSGEEVNAMQTVQDCMSNLGFGQKENILLTCPNGVIEFVSQGSSTMAVVRDGDWKPGVRETLIIIAREIDKL